MTRRGVSTIELMAVLSIIMILMTVEMKSYKYYENYISKMEYKFDIYNIREIMSFSREYCYRNQVCGELYFDNCDEFSKVYFISKKKEIKTLYITKGKKIEDSNYILNGNKSVKIDINENGYISPYTIKILNGDNMMKQIIIQVGGNLVYIKDE